MKSLAVLDTYSTPLKLVSPIIAFIVCCPIRQTVDRGISVQTVTWADLHAFAVQRFLLCILRFGITLFFVTLSDKMRLIRDYPFVVKDTRVQGKKT